MAVETQYCSRVSTADGKRRQILDAAVRVFAAQGYEASRVGDVAKEAGVAYGLVYHYFGSKDAVLDAVFREAWGRLLAAVAVAEQSGADAADQLALVVKIVLRSWRDDPDLVRLLVREITRSPHLQDELDEIGQAFASLERIVARGQAEGTFRDDVGLEHIVLFVNVVANGVALARSLDLPIDAEALLKLVHTGIDPQPE